MGKLRSIVGGLLGTLMLALGVSVYVQKSREPSTGAADTKANAQGALQVGSTSGSTEFGGTPSLTGGIAPTKSPHTQLASQTVSHVLDVDGPTPQPEKWGTSSSTNTGRPWDPTNPGGTAMTTPTSTLRYHKVIDGDTLEKLAERYLGDKSQLETIFQANRQVLIRRDLLPIGMTLTIPMPSENALAKAYSSGATAALVPVPGEPDSFPGRTVSTAGSASHPPESDLVPIPALVRQEPSPASSSSPWRASVGR